MLLQLRLILYAKLIRSMGFFTRMHGVIIVKYKESDKNYFNTGNKNMSKVLI